MAACLVAQQIQQAAAVAGWRGKRSAAAKLDVDVCLSACCRVYAVAVLGPLHVGMSELNSRCLQ